MAKVESTKCVFCKIVNGHEKTEILFQDELFVIFRDIKPATSHHYLVLTKEHIQNPKTLNETHSELVEKMVEKGKEFMSRTKGNTDDLVVGFHWPPFNSIQHLHLHVISPASQMGFIARQIFRPNSFWFVTADWLIERLKKMALGSG